MMVLSLDSATEAATCAVLNDGRLLGEITINNEKQHSVILMNVIDTLLKMLKLDISDIDGFVVSKGPGSFTGLRIGVSVIKGLSMGTGKPFVSVSTIEALAYNMAYTSGIVCPILDALRGNVYTCTYKYSKDNLVALSELEIISLEDLLIKLSSMEQPVCFLGDGVEKYKEMIISRLPNSIFAPKNLNIARSSSLGEIGLEKLQQGECENLYTFAPIYLRKSQAEQEYEKKMENHLND